jgi:hypothetical protein
VALYSTNLSIQSLPVNYAPELQFPEAGYGETPLSAADIAMHSTLVPNTSRVIPPRPEHQLRDVSVVSAEHQEIF